MTRFSLQRRGAILAAAMVCLLAIMLFAGAVARSIMLRQKSARLDEHQVQAFWLAESAALRATTKLRRDPSYRGESWRVAARVHGVAVSGVAEIKVEPISAGANRQRIKIETRWPEAAVEQILQVREFSISTELRP